MTASKCAAALWFAAALWAQAPEMATVVSKPVSRMVDLPAEIQPFLAAGLHAKVPGYVERMLVDRGSPIKEGQLLAELSAPEMQSQISEAEARVQAAESERAQSAAQLAAAQLQWEKLKKAAETPGAVAGIEVVQAEKQVDAATALVKAREQAVHSAEAGVKVLKERVDYLKIIAPFDGVVTERLAHPGALVGPASDPLLEVQQVSRLRVVVAVPEEYTSALVRGAKVEFRVPAWPDRAFAGTVARQAHALDAKTRTLPVELDAANPDGALAPGMYATAKWPVRRTKPSLWVPKTAVVTTTERTFVVRSKGGKAEWVNVTRGAAEGDLIEVSGALQAGDSVVKRATDEMREGSPLR